MKRFIAQTVTYGRKDSTMPSYTGYFVYDRLKRQTVPKDHDTLLSFESKEDAQAKADELNTAEEGQ